MGPGVPVVGIVADYFAATLEQARADAATGLWVEHHGRHLGGSTPVVFHDRG
ncbi:hypothetical protein Nm8I071_58190 [Nonomuraea sp. TT08I-71]|nr:hypothetical protein Nm8I071_58190 [Nonomuraea sp. TT08I-71]